MVVNPAATSCDSRHCTSAPEAPTFNTVVMEQAAVTAGASVDVVVESPSTSSVTESVALAALAWSGAATSVEPVVSPGAAAAAALFDPEGSRSTNLARPTSTSMPTRARASVR